MAKRWITVLDLASLMALGVANILEKLPRSRARADGARASLTQVGHGLAPWVAPAVPRSARPWPWPRRPIRESCPVLFVFQRNAAGAGHRTPVDHHVAGDQRTGFAVRPGLVQLLQFAGRCPMISAMFSSIAALAMRLEMIWPLGSCRASKVTWVDSSAGRPQAKLKLTLMSKQVL